MDQPKRLVHLEQRFCPRKRSPPGSRLEIKMLHDTALGGQLEVDQHIAAEDDVERRGHRGTQGKLPNHYQ
jgi:hypothetical protein